MKETLHLTLGKEKHKQKDKQKARGKTKKSI